MRGILEKEKKQMEETILPPFGRERLAACRLSHGMERTVGPALLSVRHLCLNRCQRPAAGTPSFQPFCRADEGGTTPRARLWGKQLRTTTERRHFGHVGENAARSEKLEYIWHRENALDKDGASVLILIGLRHPVWNPAS